MEEQELRELPNRVAQLERFIGQQAVELAILKKYQRSFSLYRATLPVIERLLAPDLEQSAGKKYSVRQLCRLLGVNRAWYYERQKLRAEREKEESELKAAVENCF